MHFRSVNGILGPTQAWRGVHGCHVVAGEVRLGLRQACNLATSLWSEFCVVGQPPGRTQLSAPHCHCPLGCKSEPGRSRHELWHVGQCKGSTSFKGNIFKLSFLRGFRIYRLKAVFFIPPSLPAYLFSSSKSLIFPSNVPQARCQSSPSDGLGLRSAWLPGRRV